MSKESEIIPVEEDTVLVMYNGTTGSMKIDLSLKEDFNNHFSGPIPTALEAKLYIDKVEAARTVQILEETMVLLATKKLPRYRLMESITHLRKKYHLTDQDIFNCNK